MCSKKLWCIRISVSHNELTPPSPFSRSNKPSYRSRMPNMNYGAFTQSPTHTAHIAIQLLEIGNYLCSTRLLIPKITHDTAAAVRLKYGSYSFAWLGIMVVTTRFVHRTLVRLLITVTIVLVAWNEFFVYDLHKLFWNSIECNSGNCTRILLVADPQLLGENFDRSIYKWVERADSDRYVRMTYGRAVKFTKPDIVCFLGDLLDEGSVASNDQFKAYVERFNSIFHTDDSIKYVHIPGDNDIGGENGEYISNSNIRRFEVEFMNNDVFDYNNYIRFFKINRMLMDFTNPSVETNKDRLRIGVSHMPILWAGGPVLRSVLKDIDPHIIFSAHWHDSRIFIYPSSSPSSSHFYDRRVEYFALNSLKSREEYLEIAVPTSSYRMGKLKIGYGFAVIDGDNVLRYTVLWTLSRFIFLGLYLIWLAIAIVIIVILNLRRRCFSKLFKRNQYNRISIIPDF